VGEPLFSSVLVVEQSLLAAQQQLHDFAGFSRRRVSAASFRLATRFNV
jgi:hypothetical protein